MPYSSRSKVVRTGVNTTYGGAPFVPGGQGSGAVWVWLADTSIPPLHDRWFEILPPWDSQILAVALAAISSSKEVEVYVGDNTEVGPAGEPVCYAMHLIS